MTSQNVETGRKKVYTQDEIKNICRDIFDRNDFVECVYLFGSYGRGEATEKSDVDFVVETNRNVGLKFFGLYDYLETALNKKVDVLTSEEAVKIMKKNFLRDRVLIYERKPRKTE